MEGMANTRQGSPNTNPNQGGPVGLTAVGKSPLAPNGPASSIQAMTPGGNAKPNTTSTIPQPSNASGSAQTKLSGLNRALALSLLYKHGVGIKAGAEAPKKKKVLVTASKSIPLKTKKDVNAAMQNGVEGYTPETKVGQLIVKLASITNPAGLRRFIKKGDSVKVAARKMATVVKLRRVFQRIGLC